jgi:hypothetical protein
VFDPKLGVLPLAAFILIMVILPSARFVKLKVVEADKVMI